MSRVYYHYNGTQYDSEDLEWDYASWYISVCESRKPLLSLSRFKMLLLVDTGYGYRSRSIILTFKILIIAILLN